MARNDNVDSLQDFNAVDHHSVSVKSFIEHKSNMRITKTNDV